MYVPSSELGLSHPLSPAIVPLPPEPRGRGAHSSAVEGLGESHFRRLENKLSTLPTFWTTPTQLVLKLFWVNKKSASSNITLPQRKKESAVVKHSEY